jgi:hypothetical protein
MKNNQDIRPSMSSSPKITSISVSTTGKPERQKDLSEKSSELGQVTAKWKPRQPEFRNKRWAECPPELSADFVRAVARDMVNEYGGGGAVSMLAMLAAGSMYKQTPQGLDVTLSCQAAGKGDAGVTLTLRDQAPEKDEDGPDLEIVTRQTQEEALASLDKSPRELLNDALGKDTAANERVIFDPLADGALTDTTLARLVADTERLFGAEHDDIEVLAMAALVLAVWRQGESNNAETVISTASGVTEGDRPVFEGRDIVMTGSVTMMDRTHTTKLSEDHSVETTLEIRKNKPKR